MVSDILPSSKYGVAGDRALVCRAMWVILAALVMAAGVWAADAADNAIPTGAAMAKADAAWQRLLLCGGQQPGTIRPGGFRLNGPRVDAAPAAVGGKMGRGALAFEGVAADGGAKGDFRIAEGVPGVCQWLGMWVYLADNANVKQVGMQVVDQEGESFMKLIPADWKGWKWVELPVAGGAMVQAYPQADKNGKIDGSLRGVSAVWFAKEAGLTQVVVGGVVALTSLPAPEGGRAVDAEIGVSDRLEPGQLAAGQLLLTNYQGAAVTCKITYWVQSDGTMFNQAPPDPVFGRDRALGAKSWMEVDGKIIEDNSLTDGKDYTDGGTPWVRDHFTEAFQYVDLGKSRKITRISYLSGDANNAYLLDVLVSADGKSYAPVDGLQSFDMYKKWGNINLSLRQPVEGRYIQLRHHTDGKKVAILRMPCRLSVYDGLAEESWELPKVGQVVGQGSVTAEVGGRSFAALDLSAERPLSPGLYLVSCRIESGPVRQLAYQHVIVLPEPLKGVSAESRFGINAADEHLPMVLGRLGVGWVRFENLKWPFVSPQPGAYAFDGSVKPWQVNHDAIFKGYRDAGLNILPFLFLTADYASSAPTTGKAGRRQCYPPKDNQSFGEFAFQVAARYGTQQRPAAELKTPDGKSGLGYLHYYEIWNEPNLTNPDWGAWVGTSEQYLEMFRVAAEAIRRADPAARITNAGYAGIQVKTVDQLRRHTYADGKHPLDFVDILNVHFYSGRIPPEIATDDFNAHQSSDITAEQEFGRLLAWRDANKPGMPIWLTETGYDSAGPFGTDEHTQAARLPRVVMMALATGIDKVFVYRESGSTANMHAASGVVRDDRSYKPSYLTYATLIRELDGVRGGAVKLPYPDKNVRVYSWRRGDQTVLTAWMIQGQGKLELNLGQATVTDAFGHRRTMDLAGGIQLSEFPVYIRDISAPKGLAALEGQARQQEAARQAQRAQLGKAQAYLYKFGGGAEAVTMDIGRERCFTPVLADEVYSPAKGYGFFPGPALGTDDRKWLSNELDRMVCKTSKGQEFRFIVRPGHYQLRLGVGPYEPMPVVLKGAFGGDQKMPAVKGDTMVQTNFQATDQVLSISVDGYANWRWLTLVEQVADK